MCASKTHFLHGQKLCQERHRYLCNQGEVLIKWQESDSEGAAIITQGPLCAIYTSDLLLNTDAMNALASDDNLNASVQLGEDEIQAFGRAHAMVKGWLPAPDSALLALAEPNIWQLPCRIIILHHSRCGDNKVARSQVNLDTEKVTACHDKVVPMSWNEAYQRE